SDLFPIESSTPTVPAVRPHPDVPRQVIPAELQAVPSVPREPAPQGSFIERAWDRVVGLGQQAEDAFTGKGQAEFPGRPELLTGFNRANPDVLGPGSVATLLAAYAAGARPDQLAAIAQQQIPGSSVFKDNKDNLMLRYGDQTFYLNKPGMSTADIAGL